MSQSPFRTVGDRSPARRRTESPRASGRWCGRGKAARPGPATAVGHDAPAGPARTQVRPHDSFSPGRHVRAFDRAVADSAIPSPPAEIRLTATSVNRSESSRGDASGPSDPSTGPIATGRDEAAREIGAAAGTTPTGRAGVSGPTRPDRPPGRDWAGHKSSHHLKATATKSYERPGRPHPTDRPIDRRLTLETACTHMGIVCWGFQIQRHCRPFAHE